MVTHLGFRLPLVVCGSVALVTAAYIVFIPESLAPANAASSFDWKRANTVTAIRTLFVTRSPESSSKYFLLAVALAFACGFMVIYATGIILVLYAQQEFDWSEATLGACEEYCALAATTTM